MGLSYEGSLFLCEAYQKVNMMGQVLRSRIMQPYFALSDLERRLTIKLTGTFLPPLAVPLISILDIQTAPFNFVFQCTQQSRYIAITHMMRVEN